jgi:hypothetical protein
MSSWLISRNVALSRRCRHDVAAISHRPDYTHETSMPAEARNRSDALVFFGATGDLACKKIFPALYALARRGRLIFPVVGVAKAGWIREQLIARARASASDYGELDEGVFTCLLEHLRYVDGDYTDPNTFVRLRAELDSRETDQRHAADRRRRAPARRHHGRRRHAVRAEGRRGGGVGDRRSRDPRFEPHG